MRFRKIVAVLIAALLIFAGLAKGAHDIWAATLTYLVVLTLAVVLVSVAGTRPSSDGARFPFGLRAVALIVVFWISFHFSINPGESFLSFMDWLTFLLLFFVSANVFGDDDAVNVLMLMMIPFFWIELTVILTQWIPLLKTTYRTEPTGTMINGNSVTGFCLIWIPALAARFFRDWKTNRALSFYVLSGLIAAAGCLIIIASAWAFVCALIGGLIYVGRARLGVWTERYRILFWTGVAGACILTAALIWYKLALIYGWHGIQARRVTTSRLEWWASAVRMWKDNPWFGIGLGNYGSAYLAYKQGTGLNTLYAHGFPVSLLAETGLFGLFSAAAFFAAVFIAGLRSEIFERRRPFVCGLAMAVAFGLLHVSFEHLANLLACAVFMGAVVSGSESWRTWKLRASVLIVIVAGGVMVSPYVVSPFMASRAVVDGAFYIQQKNFDSAQRQFHNALDLDPRAWEPYAGLARIAHEQGDDAAAVIWQRQALQRNKLNGALKRELDDYLRLAR